MFRLSHPIVLLFILLSLACSSSKKRSMGGNDGGPTDMDPMNPNNPPLIDVPSWMEPRGLNVIELIGRVPEEHLKDAIISTGANGAAAGMVRYVEGKREGRKVTLRVSLNANMQEVPYGRILLSCLSEVATFDHSTSGTPPMRMRIYGDGQDVTRQILSVQYTPLTLGPPTKNSGPQTGNRYPWVTAPQTFTTDGAFSLPANMSCQIRLSGNYTKLEASYELELEDNLKITVIGSQNVSCRNYVGPGWAGMLDSLKHQMISKFSSRHDEPLMEIPEGADYVFVKYVPKPFNEAWPSEGIETGGTYRFIGERPDGNPFPYLSGDHLASHGLPLFTHAIDSDLLDGKKFNTEFRDPIAFSCPEFFVPAGVAYQPCMTNGPCGDDVLNQIHNAPAMQETLYYYKVERTQPGLLRIPLRSVGAAFDPDADKPTLKPTALPKDVQPDDSSGCPCGWFDTKGRMLDYIPGA